MKPKGGRNRKILVYAGVAGAVLALIVLLKKRQSAGAESAEPGGPTYASAPSGIPASGETGNLSAFEASLTEHLPFAIAEGVQAGLQSNTPSQTQSLPDTLSALGAFLGSIQSSRTGEQTGAGSQLSPSSGTTPTIVSPAPAAPTAPTPVSSAPPKSAPAGPPPCPGGFPNRSSRGCYHDGKCGNGCGGHFYSSGAVECQQKTAGKCHW